MAITIEKADEIATKGGVFHVDGRCHRTIGPKGGVKEKVQIWRTSSMVKRWKRDASRIRFSVKYGLYANDVITENELHLLHAPEDCPLLKTEGEVIGGQYGV